uniref:Uncharacterized protein n=1 Tax=Apteryx owenii TaxID=8824 RepID=A0A8B9PQW9_APTOW
FGPSRSSSHARLDSAEDYFSHRHKTQILYYYKALFTKGQFLHFIAVCKRLPDFISISCTSDFIPVCFVLRPGKLMLFILKRSFFFIVIHSYFTMIAIELYKLIRQTLPFVKVLYGCVPHPFALGELRCCGRLSPLIQLHKMRLTLHWESCV